MKSRIPAFTFLLIILLTSSALAFAQKPDDLALQSAEDWLALVDSGNYAESWQQAAALFKAHVTKDQWSSVFSPA